MAPKKDKQKKDKQKEIEDDLSNDEEEEKGKKAYERNQVDFGYAPYQEKVTTPVTGRWQVPPTSICHL